MTGALAGLGVLTAASAIGAIAGARRGSRRLHYLCKPLATLLVLAAALLPPAPAGPGYRAWIAAGLVLSLAGDVLLMLPRDRFVAGLASFLLAHLCYVAAFVGDGGFRADLASLLPFAAAGAVLLAVLLPRVEGKLKAPVAVYGGAIVLMAWQAAARWLELGGTAPLLAAAGATLFVVSDAALAVDRFARPFPAAQAVVLSTYWAAQWLIALSA